MIMYIRFMRRVYSLTLTLLETLSMLTALHRSSTALISQIWSLINYLWRVASRVWASMISTLTRSKKSSQTLLLSAERQVNVDGSNQTPNG